MKTQLLEDIGQSAALPLVSSTLSGNSTVDKAVPDPAPAARARPARPRSALGVWRQKPADEPLLPVTPPPDQPAALDLHDVFEEIAALEAQFVPPEPQPEPVVAPAEPQDTLQPPPAAPLQSDLPRADATLPPDQTHTATAPQGPVFDFTPPSPAQPAANPFTPAGSTRSKQRYFLWAACLLAGGLVIGGGRWWYQERADTESLARIAAGAQARPRVETTVPPQAVAAQAFTAPPADAVRATPGTPGAPAPAIQPSPAVPPLVMLEPDPPAAPKIEKRPPPAAQQAAPKAARKSEPAVKRTPASALPKRSTRVTREESKAAATPAKKWERREPVRQAARASTSETARPAGPETSAAALLRACRERGYHATQCIKRGCSVTEYGFACRGR